ncbi:hypothetical protein RclHR1_02580013 [Rhizophagus clarus]|uniref:Uncharacterized protein n=1 Tax=Rhizophagus clarus TaxID=94130 RepID=A0A2Z6R061_9GLOM|nr:hypothetical protein RclHR1_02580013 [Rhizophagus clarus]
MNIRLSIFKIKNLPFKIYIQILLLQFTAKKEIKTLKKAKKTSKFIKVEFNKEKDKFGIKDYLENFIKHFDFDKIKEYLFLDNNNLYNTIFTTTARTNIRNKNNINKVIIEIKDSDNDKEADKYDEDDENATISTIGSCSSNCKKMNEQSCQSKLIFKALNCSSLEKSNAIFLYENLNLVNKVNGLLTKLKEQKEEIKKFKRLLSNRNNNKQLIDLLTEVQDFIEKEKKRFILIMMIVKQIFYVKILLSYMNF